jgi:hypothetical protein
MVAKIEASTSVQDFLATILPKAYQVNLHNVPAKYSNDMFLLLHSMTALLIADLLMDFLGRQTDTVAQHLTHFKEEIWLTTFLHDILKEANLRGQRLDHQDIRPDDISEWLKRLNIQLNTTSSLRLAARIAMHERSGLPLFSAFANVEEDDLPQLVIRLSDQLASLSAINEHWYYANHGLPGMTDTFNGRGRLKGLNQRMQELGATEPLTLFSHYHTRLTYPYLTNQLLAGTVAALRELEIEPLLAMADGVVYIGTEAQCALARQQAADKSDNGLGSTILNHTWERIDSAIATSPLRDVDIRATQNGMKIFAQMRLLGTPLTGERGLFNTISTYLSQRVTTKAFADLPPKKKGLRVEKFIGDTLKLISAMPKHYATTLQLSESQLPALKLDGEKITFTQLAQRGSYSPTELRKIASQIIDPTLLAKELASFGTALAALAEQTNVVEFENELKNRVRGSFESAIQMLIDGSIVVDDTSLHLSITGKKLSDKFCPTCGQQAFKTKAAGRPVSQQRETFFPVKIRSHTNSGSGAGSDGTRVVCQTCALELGLRGMGFSAEAFQNKQSVLQLHLLPFFAFPMNWMDAIQQQFGFNRRELRAQFGESTLRTLYKAFFSDDENSEWKWIRSIADPLRMMASAFFANEGETHHRDEFFGTPPLDVAGSVTLSLYTRRNELKPDKSGKEDEIGRKEMWTRGVTLAALLAAALPVRVVISESPLINFDPVAIKSSLTLVNPPEVITSILRRIHERRSAVYRFVPGENEVSHAELSDLLRLFVFALRANKALGGSNFEKDGRERSKRPSRRVVEIVQALSDELLVGAWLHQRDWQSRTQEYRPSWWNEEYRLFTQACMEVDKMLNPKEVDRLRELARITQTFYSPPVNDSAHALTLPFKIATKALQKFDATGVTEAELKTIMRSDIESAIKRQANMEGNRTWIVLKRAKIRRAPDDLPVVVQLTEGVRAFTEAFIRDIVQGICGDITNYLLLRKRLQSGYLIQMRDLTVETWKREGWIKPKTSVARQPDGTDNEADEEFTTAL